jgi:hypothetical protein
LAQSAPAATLSPTGPRRSASAGRLARTLGRHYFSHASIQELRLDLALNTFCAAADQSGQVQTKIADALPYIEAPNMRPKCFARGETLCSMRLVEVSLWVRRPRKASASGKLLVAAHEPRPRRFQDQSLRRHPRVRPNPSLNRTRYGSPAWPGRLYTVHSRQPGQAALPHRAG